MSAIWTVTKPPDVALSYKKGFKKIVFDPIFMDMNESRFNFDAIWEEFHLDIKETDLKLMTEMFGKSIVSSIFVENDVTHRIL